MPDPANTITSGIAADLEIVQRTTAADFDGHTEFQRLSPLQRLAWLDEAVAFIASAKKAKRTPVAATGLCDKQ